MGGNDTNLDRYTEMVKQKVSSSPKRNVKTNQDIKISIKKS